MSADSAEGASRLVLGVDPGLRGAAALLRVGPGERPTLERLVDASALVAIHEMAGRADVVVVEAQRSSPQMGTRSAFTLGETYGSILGVLRCAPDVGEIVMVEPSVWRWAYGLAGGAAGKGKGMTLATELLGGGDAFRRHDEADAILLAWWGVKHALAPDMVDTPESRW